MSEAGARLVLQGFVADGELTTGTKPFNVFARVASGAMVQPGMELETMALGARSALFMIACNRPENDEHWESADAEWVGKASMGKRHRFMLVRDLSWSCFNVLTFGMGEGVEELRAAMAMLEQMQVAAFDFAAATAGWSRNLGLYFHVYGHASVNALHLHIVDLDATGPTFDALSYKNLPLQSALQVLRDELPATAELPVTAEPPATAELPATEQSAARSSALTDASRMETTPADAAPADGAPADAPAKKKKKKKKKKGAANGDADDGDDDGAEEQEVVAAPAAVAPVAAATDGDNRAEGPALERV